MTLFIAQFMGLFMLAFGATLLYRTKSMIGVFDDIYGHRGIVFVIGVLETLGGLILVIVHNVWVEFLSALVSILSWIFLFEGLFYMTASSETVRSFRQALHHEATIKATGAFCFLLGAVLVYHSMF